MSILSPYRSAVAHDFMHDSNLSSQQAAECSPLPFVSLLEFVSEVYQVSWNQNILKLKCFLFIMHAHILKQHGEV